MFRNRTNKYKNIPAEADGYYFDSRKERDYYIYLREQQKQGKISDLKMQVSYEIIPAVWVEEVKHLKTKDKVIRRCDQRAAYYVADFVYMNNETGKEEVVDVKSAITRMNSEYRLKKKMMYAFNGIKIKEI